MLRIEWMTRMDERVYAKIHLLGNLWLNCSKIFSSFHFNIPLALPFGGSCVASSVCQALCQSVNPKISHTSHHLIFWFFASSFSELTTLNEARSPNSLISTRKGFKKMANLIFNFKLILFQLRILKFPSSSFNNHSFTSGWSWIMNKTQLSRIPSTWLVSRRTGGHPGSSLRFPYFHSLFGLWRIRNFYNIVPLKRLLMIDKGRIFQAWNFPDVEDGVNKDVINSMPWCEQMIVWLELGYSNQDFLKRTTVCKVGEYPGNIWDPNLAYLWPIIDKNEEKLAKTNEALSTN